MRKTGFAIASFLLISFFLGSTYIWGQEAEGDSERLKRLKERQSRWERMELDQRYYLTEPHADDSKWLQEASASQMRMKLEDSEEGFKRFEQYLDINEVRLRSLMSPMTEEDVSRKTDLEEDIKHEREMIDGIKERTERIRKRLGELEEAEKKMGPDPIEKLEGERDNIEERFKYMNDKYGFKANETLRMAFRKRGVKGKTALGYADSWDTHQLAWLNEAQPFYTYHRDALDRFIADLRNKKTVSQGQIAYFVQGMGTWRNIDRELDSLLEQMVRFMVDAAYEEDQRHELFNKINKIEKRFQDQAQKAPARQYTKIKDAENKATEPLYKKAGDHNQRSKETWDKANAIKGQIKEIGAKRLF